MAAIIFRLSLADAPWQWALRCPYDADFVEDLKGQIPSRQRKWVPEKRQWWFKDEVIEHVAEMAEHYFGHIHHADGGQREQKRQAKPEEAALPPGRAAAYRALYLTPDAPDDVIKAVYKALSKQFHPDAGGTTSAMQRLNEAYDRIKPK